ncbi:cytochrome P450 [Leucogyrophana mollusca]|uniref:Cytochrome P450 n=1 Tax=Leucogyrophana mollusca TaxID=85980 RepID=A0ACB8AXR6_9AGAM|nr:cytochrome P450 [Leucogyrophana mollusca]
MFQPQVDVLVAGLVSVGLITLLVRAKIRTTSTSLPLPPSPGPAHSFFGHKLPLRYRFLTIAGWIDTLGPVISLQQARQTFVVIGRYKAAVEIMDKQGGLLVDRPRSVAAGELLSGGMRLVLTPSGDRFKRMRRAIHTHLQPKAAESYESIQMDNAKTTILDLLADPNQFQDHVRKYAASVVQKIAYGKTTPTSASDPELQSVRAALDRMRVAMRPGAYLVDSFPFLKYLPWYGRDLKRGHELDTQLFTGQLNKVKQQLGDDEAGPSFGKYLLEHEQDYGLSEKEMAFLAGSFFAAGSDTTALALCIVILAAARHPEAQAKVQAELDTVVGNQRAPTFSDESMLPQVQAFILECMRWRPIAPSGVPHRATQDIIWENYCIPAGTTVVGNHWAISRDPDVFPNPDDFDPQRWINDAGQVRDDLKFPSFGFGRRICPGLHVANRSIFINAVLILWSFRLSEDKSQPIDEMSFMIGDIPEVKPFSIIFEPRIEEKELRCIMEGYSEGM